MGQWIMDLVERVMRSLSRFVLNKKKYDTVAYEICNELEWFFSKGICEYKMLCIIYNLINVEKIQFFSDYYNTNSVHHVHFTRTANDLHCNFIPGRSYGYATFHYNSIRMWNKLPNYLKQERSYNVFRSKLKLYFLNLQNVRLRITL